jgi:hypothetical protein
MVGCNSRHCVEGYWEGYRKYEKNERLYRHKISQMEKLFHHLNMNL